MNPIQRKAEITRRLKEAFEPETLGVEDESYMHEGHEGAKGGLSHYRVLIISSKFEAKSLIERHRMIYRELDEMMRLDIHALAIDAWSPDELDR
jgi:BolA protein